MRKSALSLIFLSSVSFAECDVANALTTLRPKAEWNLKGNVYEGIEWLDKVQIKPTEKEVQISIDSCKTAEDSATKQKEQALIDMNTKTKTDAERIDALIRYLGLESSSSITTRVR